MNPSLLEDVKSQNSLTYGISARLQGVIADDVITEANTDYEIDHVLKPDLDGCSDSLFSNAPKYKQKEVKEESTISSKQSLQNPPIIQRKPRASCSAQAKRRRKANYVHSHSKTGKHSFK